MPVWRRVVFLVVSLVLLSLLTTFLLSLVIFQTSYLNLEKQSLERDVDRATSSLSVSIDKLAIDTKDWAAWDDTYYFATDGNDNYIKNYFADAVFETKKLNLILVLDRNGHTVYGKAYDLNKHQEMSIPQEFGSYLSADVLTKHIDTSDGTSGIILLADTPLLISSQPILTSLLEGPTSGTLIFGNFMNSDFINALSKTTESSITMWQENVVQIPDDFQKAKRSLSEEGVIFTHPLDSGYAAGYTLIDDVFGNPAIVLKVTIPRDIYKQGRITLVFVFVALAFASLLYGLLFVSVVKKSVFSRFIAISKGVRDISDTADISKHLSVGGDDELSHLADNINAMLDRIGETEARLRSQRDMFDRISVYSPNISVVVDENNNIKFVNKAFCSLFNISGPEVIGKHLNTFVPADEKLAVDPQISTITGSISTNETSLKINEIERTFDIKIITMSPNEFLLICRDTT